MLTAAKLPEAPTTPMACGGRPEQYATEPVDQQRQRHGPYCCRRGSGRTSLGHSGQGLRSRLLDHEGRRGHIPVRVRPTRVRVPSADCHHRSHRKDRRAHPEGSGEARRLSAAGRPASRSGLLATIPVGPAAGKASTQSGHDPISVRPSRRWCEASRQRAGAR